MEGASELPSPAIDINISFCDGLDQVPADSYAATTFGYSDDTFDFLLRHKKQIEGLF